MGYKCIWRRVIRVLPFVSFGLLMMAVLQPCCDAWILLPPGRCSSSSLRAPFPVFMSEVEDTGTINNNHNRMLHSPSLGAEVAEMVRPHVVLVSPKGVRNMTSRGSGFVLDLDLDLDDDDVDDILASFLMERSSSTTTSTASTFSLIVTAAHVTPPGYTVQVTWPSPNINSQGNSNSNSNSNRIINNKVPATVVARNSTLDLALLLVEEKEVVATFNDKETTPDDGGVDNSIATSPSSTTTTTTSTTTTKGLRLSPGAAPPPVGSLVFAHGYPASRLRGPAMTSGIVCGIADGVGGPDDDEEDDDSKESQTNARRPQQQQQHDTTTFVVTDAAMSGGMSGGPLVDASGHVVGINALIRPDLRALGNFAVSSLELKTFLQSAKSKLVDLLNKNTSNNHTETTTTTMTMAMATNNSTSTTTTTTTTTTIWLYNDRMNKKERVASILQTVAGLNTSSAEQVMMQAHSTGRGMVGNYSSSSFESSSAIIAMGQALRDQDLLIEWETDDGR